MMKKILVINPVILHDARDEGEYLSRFIPSGFRIEITGLKYGSETIETFYDEVLTAPFVVRLIEEKAGLFDAFVINCFMDPGLRAAREICSVPVVGAGESSIIISLSLGDSFGIIDVGCEGIRRRTTEVIRSIGVQDRFVGLRSLDLSVKDLLNADRKKLVKDLVKEGKILVDEGADVIVLGCTGFIGVSEEPSKELEVPVIDPAVAATNFAVLLVSMGVGHSRRTYLRPGIKKRRVPF
jgi:allantoin racemase